MLPRRFCFSDFARSNTTKGRIALFASVLVQLQRDRIDAEALAGWLWAIVEDVSQVGVTPAATDFGAAHPVRQICFGAYGACRDRRVEAGPPGARVVLCFGTKQRLPATHALIGTLGIGGLIFTCEGRLSALLAGYKVLIRRELLAPLCVTFMDFISHKFPCNSMPEWCVGCNTFYGAPG